MALRGEATEALKLIQKAIGMYWQLGDKAETASALESLGWAQFVANEYDPARKSFEDCLCLQSEIGDSAAIYRAKVGLAQVLVALKEL
jgi:tetratricopeptide (TPR) repeat protein